MLNRKILFAAFAALVVAGPLLADDKAGGLKKEKEIALEGEPFFDYLLVDSAHRLPVHGCVLVALPETDRHHRHRRRSGVVGCRLRIDAGVV